MGAARGRARWQHARSTVHAWSLQIPHFPSTTIGSFPQTRAIRKARGDLKAGRISAAEYERQMDTFIAHVIGMQEGLGLDVLVHGEPERSDMCAVSSLSMRSVRTHTQNHDECTAKIECRPVPGQGRVVYESIDS